MLHNKVLYRSFLEILSFYQKKELSTFTIVSWIKKLNIMHMFTLYIL